MHVRKIMQEYTPNTENAIHKKRVCAYARVSSIRDEAFHSLSSQVSYYQQKIAEHPDWEYVEVFSDRGITGTKDDRPGFQAMLTACREGKVDIVLAKSITRFARNTVILLETVRELKKLGVDIHFEEEGIETLGRQGEFMISILAARAQEESRSASENQLWRIRKSYEQGIPVTGNCLGYRLVNGQFLVEETEEPIVKRVFSMYLSGMGCTAIAKQFRAENIPSPLGKEWSVNSIRRILRNEKYCGDLILQKKYRQDHITKKTMENHGEKPKYKVENVHEAIIPRSVFDEVQHEIEKRAKNIGLKKAEYPFSKLIVCGHCGQHYLRKINAAGTPHAKPTWSCLTSNQWGKSACPCSQRIPEDILTEKTCELLGTDTIDTETLRNLIDSILVPENNVLIYRFKDGSEKRIEWQFRSRSKSWTPEMREKARQRALAQNSKQKGEK